MSKQEKWTENDIPDMTGKVVIMTGANSGIGYEATRALAQNGATVVMACRNMKKANEAVKILHSLVPAKMLDVMALDLSSLASVRQFTTSFLEKYDRLDLLINNAGLMAIPFGLTKDGFESQIGVNHLGHFALTGLLLERLLAIPASRIINISSGAHKMGKIHIERFASDNEYTPFGAYGQSKLANLLFTYELQRRLGATNTSTISVAAHPGGSKTNLGNHLEGFFARVVMPIFSLVMQSAAMGALPTLLAATDSSVQGSDYYGPGGFQEMRGHPKKVTSNELSHDKKLAQRLWSASEELTGVTYSFGT